MTMGGSKGNGMSSEINVTPMIDILLVLLIVFMVIVPAVPRGESLRTPQARHGATIPKPDAVVLEMLKVGGGLAFKINRQPIARHDLGARLASICANRAERVLFLSADDQISFTDVAEVIDMSHAAGVDHVGLMTPGVMADHQGADGRLR